MSTVLIAGGSGLVGTALSHYLLQKNYEVIILTRQAGKPVSSPHLQYAVWDTDTRSMDVAALAKADYIINLAGAGVADKRWTRARKKEIQQSRINSGITLVKNLTENPHKVKAFINASAIGWYGADPQIPNLEPFTEDKPHDPSFLGETCFLWESSVDGIANLNIPLIKLRIGIVLSKEGGALKEFLKPLQWGVAAVLGSGKQMISWIHIDDLCRMIEHCMLHNNLTGVFNAVAPQPVNNKTLTLALAKKIRHSFFLPVNVPSFALKLLLGEMSIEVLKSATVSCKKIQETGFTFLYPSVTAALEDLCSR
jgi:uncharacterized protein (TIGR01777 family)